MAFLCLRCFLTYIFANNFFGHVSGCFLDLSVSLFLSNFFLKFKTFRGNVVMRRCHPNKVLRVRPRKLYVLKGTRQIWAPKILQKKYQKEKWTQSHACIPPRPPPPCSWRTLPSSSSPSRLPPPFPPPLWLFLYDGRVFIRSWC